jgi:pimeloyl-ACP methyl ester carboxylesterase
VTLSVPHPLAPAEHLARHPSEVQRSWYLLFFQLPRLPERALARGDFALVDRLWRAWSPGFEPAAEQRARLHACLRDSMPAPLEYYRALRRGAADWAPAGSPRTLWRRSRRDLNAGGARTGTAAPFARPIQLPVLHLHGARDGCIAPEAGRGQRRYLTGPFDSEILAGTGHFLLLEDPDQVSRRALRWLRMYFPPLVRAVR